jgi:hypothetical protein
MTEAAKQAIQVDCFNEEAPNWMQHRVTPGSDETAPMYG